MYKEANKKKSNVIWKSNLFSLQKSRRWFHSASVPSVSAWPTIHTAYLARVIATFSRCHSFKNPIPVKGLWRRGGGRCRNEGMEKMLFKQSNWMYSLHCMKSWSIEIQKNDLESNCLEPCVLLTSDVNSISPISRCTYAREDDDFLFSSLKSVYCGDFYPTHGRPEPVLEHCFDESSLRFVRCDYAHTCPVGGV